MSDYSNYWTRRRISRRGALRAAGLTGVGIAGAALIGCGEDDEDGDGGGGTATVAPGTPTQTGAASPTPSGTEDPFAHVKRGGTWQGTATNDPPTIDPYGNLSFLTKGTAAYAYSRLYKVANRPDVNPWTVGVEADLAEEDGAETEDGQHWTVRMKQGVMFHNKPPVDGREVTAEDVVFSFQRLIAEDSPQRSLAIGAGFDNVEAVDDYTLRFTLAQPSAAFLDNLADTNMLFVLPTEYDGGYDPRTEMIGSGPWILESYEPSTAFTWRANPDYFIEGQPFLDGARIAIIPEYANRMSQLEAGNTHADGISADDVLGLRDRQPDLQWSGLQSSLLSFIYFSPADVEPDTPWQDVRFRQAISMAQDRDATTDLGYNTVALSEAGLDVAMTWNNLIPAGFGERWWLDPQSDAFGDGAQYFQFNVDEARALIEAGGWNGATFPYRWANNVYGSTFNRIAEAIGNFIADIGLSPETQTEDYASRYITNTFRGDFTGIAFGYETPFPEVGGYFPRMFGDDPANHSRWSGPEVDRIRDLSAQQAQELDEEARRELIHEIQRINGANLFYIPQQAGAGTGWTAYRPEVRGIRQTRGYGGATENLIHFWLDT